MKPILRWSVCAGSAGFRRRNLGSRGQKSDLKSEKARLFLGAANR